MKENILKITCVIIAAMGVSSFYLIDSPTKAYTVFFLCLIAFIVVSYISESGRLKLNFLKESFDDIKTYSIPKTKDVINQTGYIIVIAIFLGTLVFFMDNGIRYLISLI